MKLYLELVKVQIKSALQYKLSFFTEVLGVVLGYVGNIIIYYIMFQKFEGLNGWKFEETMFVYTFAQLAINISNVFYSHFCLVDTEVIDGSFDKYLIRPISDFRYYLISKFNVSQFVTVFISMILFIIIANKIGFCWSLLNVIILILCLSGSILINSGTLVLVGAIAFWTKKSQEMYDSIVWPAQYLSYLPLSIFPKLIKVLFTFFVPLAFLSYYPSTIFLGKTSEVPYLSKCGYLTLIIGIIFYFITYMVWRIGIKNYESSGS